MKSIHEVGHIFEEVCHSSRWIVQLDAGLTPMRTAFSKSL